MVLLEKQTTFLLVLGIFSLLFLVTSCVTGNLDTITGRVGGNIYSEKEEENDFECYSDSDCGTDTFIGDSYCIEGDVYGMYREYECLMTIDSSVCRVQTYDKLIEECDETRGEECVAKINYCVLADEPARQDCKFDKDCGVDGLQDKPFCFDGDVYDTNVTYDCYGGTCRAEREPVFMEDCLDYCFEGECTKYPEGVECFTDSDCKGKDGFFGPLYCREENSVYRTVGTSDCANDKCVIRATLIKIGECSKGERCAVGMGCVEINHQPIEVIKPITNITTNITNATAWDGEGEDGSSEKDDRDRPFEPIQYRLVGKVCDNNSDCGEDGFIGDPYCFNDDVYAGYVKYTCNDEGLCDKLVESRLVTKCNEYTFCVPEDYSCQDKSVDLKIVEVLLDGEPFLVDEGIDVYLKIENLGINNTLYGLKYGVTYPDGHIETQDAPPKYKIAGHEIKTIFIKTETFTEEGDYSLYFELISSEPEYSYDNNIAEVDIFVNDPDKCNKYVLGICVEN